MPNTALLGFVGIFIISMEFFSIMTVGLLSLKFILLKETHHLLPGQMIMVTLLFMMAANADIVVVIIFYLTVL